MTFRDSTTGILLVLGMAFASGAIAGTVSTPLHDAPHSGDIGKVVSTALHDAANKGNFGEVKRLIEEGMDVNARSRGGYTPLRSALGPHRACLVSPCKVSPGLPDDYRAIVALLIQHGANVNETEDGVTQR